ncbi:MAG: hypothetical protein H7255_01295 [Ramlibacter sp.]|nr:hypothetical protein [Ramlibacter sp.]
MTVYHVKLWEADVSPEELLAAESRFREALDGALGSEHMVLPMYDAYRRLSGIYGEDPDMEDLSEAERLIFTQWQEAALGAVAAAFGPNRYMGDAMYEISDPVDKERE